jgi:hypothetical protein
MKAGSGREPVFSITTSLLISVRYLRGAYVGRSSIRSFKFQPGRPIVGKEECAAD